MTQNQPPILIHRDAKSSTSIIMIQVSNKHHCKLDKILRNFRFEHNLWFSVVLWRFLFFWHYCIFVFDFAWNFKEPTLQHRGEAELRCTFWLVSWDYGPRKTFQSMICDMIDAFRNIKPAVNFKFVRKSQIETTPSHIVSYSKKKICQSCLFSLRNSAAQCFQKFAQ